MFERPKSNPLCCAVKRERWVKLVVWSSSKRDCPIAVQSTIVIYIQSVVGNVLITAIRMSAVAFPFVRNKVDKRLSPAPYANIQKKNRRKSFSIGLNHWHAQVSINRHTFWKEKCTHLMAARSCSVAKIVFFATPFSVTSFHHGFENTIGNTSNRNK